MCAVSVYFRFFGRERVCVSLFEPRTLLVHRTRPSTTCTRRLPAEHCILGHQAISLVSIIIIIIITTTIIIIIVVVVFVVVVAVVVIIIIMFSLPRHK